MSITVGKKTRIHGVRGRHEVRQISPDNQWFYAADAWRPMHAANTGNSPMQRLVAYLVLAGFMVFAMSMCMGRPAPEGSDPMLDRNGNPISLELFNAWNREDRELRELCRKQGHTAAVCKKASDTYRRERLQLP